MSAPPSNALTAEGLNTYYGKSHILHDVGLAVAAGQITTLLGRNGAGKTTTLRSLVGLTQPRSGRVTLFGTDITGQPPYRIAASGVGYVPEGRRVFANLTVDENLRVPIERPGPYSIERVYQLFPGWNNASRTLAASCPAVSRKCCRSAAPCCLTQHC